MPGASEGALFPGTGASRAHCLSAGPIPLAHHGVQIQASQ